MSQMSEEALRYQQQGWSIFPVKPGPEKLPYVKWASYQREPAPFEQITAWWEEWPDANIGLATGQLSGVVVVDLDGPVGFSSWAQAGFDRATRRTSTGREGGGEHLFYQHPGGERLGNRAGFLPKVDLRGDGGFVVLPPSRHHSGRLYAWVNPEAPIAVMPQRLYELLRVTPASPPPSEPDEPIRDGVRNDRLYRFGRSLHRHGMAPERLLETLLKENAARCVPPLPESEVVQIARKAATQAFPPEGPPRPVEALLGPDPFLSGDNGGPPPAGGTADGDLQTLALVVQERIEWIWQGRLGRGLLSLLCGDPGVGKSLTAIDIIARITRGAAWPDERDVAPRGDVLICASEDDPARVLRPRLHAASGDVDHVEFWSAVRAEDGLLRPLDLRVDLERVERRLREHPVALLVVDPLHSFLGEIDITRAEKIRPVLARLVQMAWRLGIAVLGIVHFSKAGDRQSLYRLIGSISQAGLARIILGVGPHPLSESQRVLVPIKQNLTGRPPTLAFTIVAEEPAPAPHVLWDPEPLSAELAPSAEAAWSSPAIARRRFRVIRRLRDLQAVNPGQSLQSKDLGVFAKTFGIGHEYLSDLLHDLGYSPRQANRAWVWDPPGDHSVPDWVVVPPNA
jgi:Bifunctional DNA primase/polymerase, N-terminal/AAA domain